MSSANPTILKLSKKYPSFKKIYLYYNIYIRNFKFFFNTSQFGEDKKIIKLFEKNKKGTYVDVGCFHPTRQNNTYLMYKLGWSGVNIDLNPLTIELFDFMLLFFLQKYQMRTFYLMIRTSFRLSLFF